jgi:phosphoribosylformimino-5-aminoimidazole carboxamide ribotide isomerase
MYILPAIDLIAGKCVRLIKGRYDRQLTYEAEPIAKAMEFISAGAEWVHIVDLDGARLGRPVNIETVEAIANLGRLKIQFGGGLRDRQAVQQMLQLGIERVIIGTKAVSDFAWFERIAAAFPGRIALGLDARGSSVAINGWKQDSCQQLLDFTRRAGGLPIAAIIYTDIDKDGMLAGPNLERTRMLIEAVRVPVIAAGGVSRVTDVINLARAGAAGAVIGRALYEGTIDLAEAIRTASEHSQPDQ